MVQGVRVIGAQYEIETKRRVTVQFIYNEAIIGTMFIRIKEQKERHLAAEFMEKLGSANKIVEFFEHLNTLQFSGRNLISFGTIMCSTANGA